MALSSSIPPSTSRVWLCVLKTNVYGEPRRRADRPRVIVKPLSRRPGHELDQWVKKSRRARRMRVVDALYELMPGHAQPGGRDNAFIKPAQNAEIQAAAKALRERLRCDGYTVNGDMTVWHLYVIELDCPRQTGKAQPKGDLYVGQTSLAVEDRIRQHREGHTSTRGHQLHSRLCHKYFKQPRLDLLPEDFQQSLFCKEDALTAEADLRIYFESQGYRVAGGTERLDARRKALGID